MTVAFGACQDGLSPLPVPPKNENRTPVAEDAMPALKLASGRSAKVNLAEYMGDPDGEVLAYTAASADEAVATAALAGAGLTVTGVSRGETTVTVTGTDTGGLSVSQSFSVTVDGVTIRTAEPEVLLEGRAATILGSGFSTAIQNNLVLIDGVPAPVTEASSTRLSILVPRAECLPPKRAELRITVLGLTDTLSLGVSPRTQADLDLKTGWYRYTYAGNGCLHLPGNAEGGEWLIGVMSTSPTAASLARVTLTGISGDLRTFAAADAASLASAAAAPEEDVAKEGIAFAGTIPDDLSPGDPGALAGSSTGPEPPPGLRQDWERHDKLMADTEELLRRLGPPSAAPTAQSRASATGDTVTLFGGIPESCTERATVRAVVRLVGENSIWLEDVDNPGDGFTDSELAGLDAFYANHARPVHNRYFGSLTDIDGLDRFVVLMTKEVNREPGLRGYVWAGDLYPGSECLVSNQAEIFYGQVPDPDGLVGRPVTKESLLDYYPSLLTHEVTHIVQRGAQIYGGAGLKERWELEGGATLSEQLVAYRLFGHESIPDRGRTEYEEGRAWYSEWASGMARFFGWGTDGGSRRVPGAPEQCSWAGSRSQGNDGPCLGRRQVYDVPSMLLRFVMDRWGGDYPGGEEALMRRLTQSPRGGYGSLAEVSESRIELLLANFYLSVWMDLHGADLFPSWDLREIWSEFDEAAWLRPYTATAAGYEYEWNIRAGSSSYLRWSPEGDAMAPTSLRVTAPDGGRVPEHVSVWALRLR